MARVVKGEGKAYDFWGRKMHGSAGERRLMTQQRGRAASRRGAKNGLGPAAKHGKATPKNPGRGGWFW